MQSRMLSRPPNSITQRSMPSAMPPCGGAPYFKRPQQEAEPLLGRLLVDAQQRKHLLLNRRIVNPDRAAARFAAVDHQVVRLRPALARVGLEQSRNPDRAAT